MGRVGNIIITYSRLVEKLGEPNIDGGWALSTCKVTGCDSADISKNRTWNVYGSNRDDLITFGDLFKKADRIIY